MNGKLAECFHQYDERIRIWKNRKIEFDSDIDVVFSDEFSIPLR
jgi:hypothetical protein